MNLTTGTPNLEALFQRSLSSHLPGPAFDRLQKTSVLIAGLGGGSNIAELLARKGVGRFVIADLDVYEPHNIRQRGSTSATWGKEKVEVMAERLRDINPFSSVTAVREGVTLANVRDLIRQADVAVDMLDFHALKEKVALHRAAREQGKTVLTAPSVVNGAVLYVFAPDGPTFEDFFEYQEGLPLGEQALGRTDRVVAVPRGIQIDASDPGALARIVDFTKDFEVRS